MRRYFDMQYGPGVVPVSGLGMVELGEIATKEEADRLLAEGRAYMESKIDAIVEWLAGANASVQAMQRYAWDLTKQSELETNLAGAFDEVEKIMAKAFELRDQGIIDQRQVDQVFQRREQVVRRIQELSVTARNLRTEAEMTQWLAQWAVFHGPLEALKSVISGLQNIWKKIGEIAEPVTTLWKWLPWVVLGVAGVLVLKETKGLISSNPGSRRRRGRRGIGATLPLLLAAGAAYVVLSKPKPRVPVVTELIPTVSAARPAVPEGAFSL